MELPVHNNFPDRHKSPPITSFAVLHEQARFMDFTQKKKPGCLFQGNPANLECIM
jgi:hypothetical protein